MYDFPKYNLKWRNPELSRPQWERSLRHEMSSAAGTLELWVRIPLEAWMSVCVYSVFVLSFLVSGFATGLSSVQGVIPTICKIHNFRINFDWKDIKEPNPSRQKKEKVSELWNLARNTKYCFICRIFIRNNIRYLSLRCKVLKKIKIFMETLFRKCFASGFLLAEIQ
jgi:hypothetical protein